MFPYNNLKDYRRVLFYLPLELDSSTNVISFIAKSFSNEIKAPNTLELFHNANEVNMSFRFYFAEVRKSF